MTQQSVTKGFLGNLTRFLERGWIGRADRPEGMGGHISQKRGHFSQKWYEFTTGDPEIDRYDWV